VHLVTPMRSFLRTAWRISRIGLIVALLPIVALVQLTIILIFALPFDRRDLIATSEPLVLVDVRGDEIVTLPAQGLDRTHWTALGDVPAIAVSAVVESEDERFWDHRGSMRAAADSAARP
jgi:membrane peptidoglycan carboxypeptidase